MTTQSGSASPRAATLTDVARLAGVSIATASKAINGRDQVKAETRLRVLEAAERLSFAPNALARGLLKGRTGTVGLLTSDLEAGSRSRSSWGPRTRSGRAACRSSSATRAATPSASSTTCAPCSPGAWTASSSWGRGPTRAPAQRRRPRPGRLRLRAVGGPLRRLDHRGQRGCGPPRRRAPALVQAPPGRARLGRPRVQGRAGPRGGRRGRGGRRRARARRRADVLRLVERGLGTRRGAHDRRAARRRRRVLLRLRPDRSRRARRAARARPRRAGRVSVIGFDNWEVLDERPPQLTSVDMNLERLRARRGAAPLRRDRRHGAPRRRGSPAAW